MTSVQCVWPFNIHFGDLGAIPFLDYNFCSDVHKYIRPGTGGLTNTSIETWPFGYDSPYELPSTRNVLRDFSKWCQIWWRFCRVHKDPLESQLLCTHHPEAFACSINARYIVVDSSKQNPLCAIAVILVTILQMCQELCILPIPLLSMTWLLPIPSVLNVLISPSFTGSGSIVIAYVNTLSDTCD